ncbi:hypothetical protein ACHAXT_008100 [Thalassiosira profunda]
MSSPTHRGSRSGGTASAGAASAGKASSPKKRSTSPAKTAASAKAPRTPPKRSASASTKATAAAARGDARIVTPATSLASSPAKKSPVKSNARRSLSMPSPIKEASPRKSATGGVGDSAKKLPFGGRNKPIDVPPNVQRVYDIVRKHTGSIGGNGSGGAIYGELTSGSMQKMTNLMIEHTGLSSESRFIDVGCGLGKPNLHVAQYPGVEFSYGIEMEHVRWLLGMANLHHVLKVAKNDAAEGPEGEDVIGHRCYFAHGDIEEANHFDPFTHVYMFDIGFPPRLFGVLAEMFNASQSEYLICYHGPKLMIEKYGFNVELLVQTPTSMHGSAEGHTGYIYRRSEEGKASSKVCKTKEFGERRGKLCRSGLDNVHEQVQEEVEEHMGATKKRVTRSASRQNSIAEEEKKSE